MPFYLQQLCGSRPFFWVFLQTLLDKVLERLRPQVRVPERWRRVGGNHEDGLEEENRNIKGKRVALNGRTQRRRTRSLTLMGCMSAYGGFPSAISMAVIPRDQMSAKQLYPISCMTSGAIQNGVPMTVFRFAMVS